MKYYQYGLLIKAINTEIQKHINNQLANAPEKPPRLTGTQMAIMGELYDHPDKIVYQRDLEKLFNLSRPTINGVIKRLRDANMIRVLPSTEDKRYKQIVLTDGARKEMQRHKPEFDRNMSELETQLTKGMTKAEVSEFQQLLVKALQNIKALDEK